MTAEDRAGAGKVQSDGARDPTPRLLEGGTGRWYSAGNASRKVMHWPQRRVAGAALALGVRRRMRLIGKRRRTKARH